MKIIAIDPGMASCGFVCMEHGKKLQDFGYRLTTPGKNDDGKNFKTNKDALRRANEITESVFRFIIDNGQDTIDAIVIEEFVDIAKAKGRSYLWTTPMSIGYIVAMLQIAFPNITICWQNPSVLPPVIKREKAWYELSDRYCMDAVDSLAKTNREHVQSAAFHGAYFLDKNRPRK